MPEGTLISDDLQLIRVTDGRYELKPVDPCTVPVFNKKLNNFLKTLPVISNAQFCRSPGDDGKFDLMDARAAA